MKDDIRTIIFATVLAIICATALTAANQILGERIETNRKAEKIRNILVVLGIKTSEEAKQASAEEIIAQKDGYQYVPKGGTCPYDVYKYIDGGEVKSIAIPFEGKGLWATIKGFIALDSEYKTISGVSFYQQEETPGLGAEIVLPDFTDRFVGKFIDSGSKPGISIIPPGSSTPGDNEIYGISGATLTCDKVEAMLNVKISEIVNQRDK